MILTLNIQGATPEEIVETCKQFADMGVNNRITTKPVQIEGPCFRRRTLGGKAWTEDEKQTAKALYNSGASWREIAETINRLYGNNRTADAVREFFKRLRKQA